MEEAILNALKGKNVLITGGCGFLGSNIAHALANTGANITIFDIMQPDVHENDVYHNIANVEEIKDKVRLVKGDIRDFEAVCDEVKGKDIIFHCAGHTSHPQSLRNPHLNLDINCKGSLNLLEAARRFNDKARIVYVATSTQIGAKKKDVIDEDHSEFPRDIYSANKMAAEKYHLIYNYIHKIPTIVLRAGNTYGPRAAIHSPNFGFINYFIGLALKGKDLTIYGEGQQKRSVTFVDDITDAILRAAIKKEVVGETMFITRENSYTIKEIAEAIVEVFGNGKIKSIPWPDERKAMEVGDVMISNKKSRESLGWIPKTELKDGLKKTKEYYEPRIGKYLK